MTGVCCFLTEPVFSSAIAVAGSHSCQSADAPDPAVRVAALAAGAAAHARDNLSGHHTIPAEQSARGVQPRHQLCQQDQKPLPGTARHLQSLPGDSPHVSGQCWKRDLVSVYGYFSCFAIGVVSKTCIWVFCCTSSGQQVIMDWFGLEGALKIT